MLARRLLPLPALLLALTTTLAREARADDAPDTGKPLPESTVKDDSASKGATEIATDTFAAAAVGDDEKSGTEVTLQGGGLFATGNSRSLAVTAGGDYRVRAKDHQLTLQAAANYGRAATDVNSPVETTVENLQGLVRYDYFFADHWSVFLQGVGRRDRFQGLDFRLNVDPGFAYFVLENHMHRLWFEAGYDYQHDIRRDENLEEAAAKGTILDKTADRHSARLFTGYVNKLNTAVTVSSGLEYLQSVDDTTAWRMNFVSSLKSVIAPHFAAATTLTVRYDHDPLPGVKTLDTITSVSLAYSAL